MSYIESLKAELNDIQFNQHGYEIIMQYVRHHEQIQGRLQQLAEGSNNPSAHEALAAWQRISDDGIAVARDLLVAAVAAIDTWEKSL